VTQKGVLMQIASCLIGFALSRAAAASALAARIERILIFEGDNLVYVYAVCGLVNPPSCHGCYQLRRREQTSRFMERAAARTSPFPRRSRIFRSAAESSVL
jgi:hypothetical protein